MIYVWFLTCFWFSLSFSQQYYDETLCSSGVNKPGTRYTCRSSRNPCETFLVYRVHDEFRTIARISSLFSIDSDILVSINDNVTASSQVLETGHEVLVPVLCSCTGEFSQANLTYRVTENAALSEIACGVFEGLVKSIALAEENRLAENDNVVSGTLLRVPLRCACPDDHLSGGDHGVKFLITYPFVERDDTLKLGKKFNVSVEEIWKANHMDPTPTVYPNTTVLVPLKDKPFINFNIPVSDPPAPQFLPTMPVEKRARFSQLKKLYIAASAIGFCLILAVLLACGLYIKALKMFKAENFRSWTHRVSSFNLSSTPRSCPFSGPPTRSSTNSCLSPDFLVGIKYSLCNYSMEELKRATKNFSQDAKISSSVYRGVMDNGEVMIKQMKFEGTRRVIDVHSKINHVNVVKLHGVCYGEDDFSWSYLVFELPSSGSLRDCLSASSAALHWLRRTQIAFDIATGLHYLHHSVVPAYTHLNVSSKNVFLTSTWRAKIAIFEKECGSSKSPCGGVGAAKEDIFAFGVVLLELVSGREAVDDGELLSESMRFLGGGCNEGGCFDQLRKFVDPCLKDDYPLAEALCLAVLAGSCVEDDPLHRPSMDDVLKVLARMV
ncbi:LysM domain receptor-like kinase [Sesamum alatum]|uniref:LysM domain receptor-like kinase n=1 Tax=Sesamum alatum TaxID=300844 RepID=A0AAE2CZW9_9LAMI|nr:LysM domain receptor-like kinase [Sesamum alatum]